jgi:hypothetical protein
MSLRQDLEHLRLLAVLHYVLGGINAVLACCPVIYLGMGVVMIAAPDAFDGGKGQGPPPELGWFFVVLGAFVMLFGWTLATCVILAGRFLAQHRNYIFCFVVAVIMCVFMMPFGTVLGVFTIIVLMRQSVRVLFGQEPPVSLQAQL